MLDQDKLHPDDKRNLVIFCCVAALIWFGFNHYVMQPRLDRAQAAKVYAAQHPMTPADVTAHTPQPRDTILAAAPRLKIDNGAVFGSVALKGGRLDDLSLSHYSATLGKNDHVVLLAPAGTAQPEYVESGWVGDASIKLPDADTVWQSDDKTLGPDGAAHLHWDNGQGLRFERTLAIDANYLITQTDTVRNDGGRAVKLSHYDLVSEHGLPDDMLTKSGRVFEGAEGFVDGSLQENGYAALAKKPLLTLNATTGWIGLSQKYWFTGLIPDQQAPKTFRYVYTPSPDPATGNKDTDKLRRPEKYQVDVTSAVQDIAPGGAASIQTRIFAGAKEAKLLRQYDAQMPGLQLDRAIDWGLYWFLTRPFFFVLDFFGHVFGNFGFALVALTIAVRLAVFPLANTSFKSFAKMKKIAPEMKGIREEFGADKEKLQAALVKLYEKEKVNPMAGCLPLVVQIPIFFALYKVLSVTIELRHAPFIGWIHDLSAPDPSSIFNLFGLLPFTPPAFLPIFGGWSCLMLLAMLAQRQLSPPAQDKSQQMTANVMPFMVTYIMSKSPAGLVIYWTFSNAFSVLQQYIIMRSLGADVHFLKRSKEDKDMEKLVASQPEVHPGLATIVDEADQALTKPVSPPKPKRKTKR